MKPHGRSGDPAYLRLYAEQWRDAKLHVLQNDIAGDMGVRWSVLWKLPYWDPTKQLVVDPMHCILEGLVKALFRDHMKLTEDEAKRQPDHTPAFSFPFQQVPNKEDDPSNPIFNPNEKDAFLTDKQINQVPVIHKILLQPLLGQSPTILQESRKKLQNRLHAQSKGALKFVVDSLGIAVGKENKDVYISRLLEWASKFICNL